MKRLVWVLPETVVALHEQLLAAFGGSVGVRDAGLLLSAMARPQHLLAYGTPTVFALAACYAFGLVKNHPFVDGNKRTGIIASLVFLDLNGAEIDAPKGSLYDLTMSVANGRAGKKEVAEFFRKAAH